MASDAALDPPNRETVAAYAVTQLTLAGLVADLDRLKDLLPDTEASALALGAVDDRLDHLEAAIDLLAESAGLEIVLAEDDDEGSCDDPC